MKFGGTIEDHLTPGLAAIRELDQGAVLEIVMDAAEPTRAAAQSNAPRSPFQRIRHLQDVIVAIPLRERQLEDLQLEGPAVVVGPDRRAFWGPLVEFGTKFKAPRPFLRPAFDSGAAGALRTIASGLWRLIERSARP